MSFLNELRELNIERQKEWDPDNKATLSFRGLEFAGEAGELASKIKKLARKTEFDFLGSDYDMTDIKEEVGDVLITLDLVCNMMGIDIEEVTREKFNATSDKVGLITKFKTDVIEPPQRPKNFEELYPHYVMDNKRTVIGIIFAPEHYQFSELCDVYYELNPEATDKPDLMRRISRELITMPEHMKDDDFETSEKLYCVSSHTLKRRWYVYANSLSDAKYFVEYEFIPLNLVDSFKLNLSVYVSKETEATVKFR